LAILSVLYIDEHAKEAVALLEDNVTLYYKTSSPNPHWIIIMMVLAQGYIRLKKPNGAMSHLAQARSQLDRFLADDTPPPWLAPAMGLTADIYFALEEFSIGATLLEKRVNLQSSYLRLDDNRRLSSLRKLAQVYTRLEDSRKLKQVVELLEEVIDDGQKTIHTDFKDSKLTGKVLAYAQWNLAQARRTRQSVVGIRGQQSGQEEAASNPSASTVATELTMPPQGRLPCAQVADLHTDQSPRRAKEYKTVLVDRSRLKNTTVSSTPIPKIVNPSAAESTGIPGYLRETTASRRARETISQAKAEIMNRLLIDSDIDEEDTWDFVFVDSIDHCYNKPSAVPVKAPSNSDSPFISKTPHECAQLLLELRKDTDSEIIPHYSMIMDERSLQDDTVLLVTAGIDAPVYTVRATFGASAQAIVLYLTGHRGIEEDIESASQEDDGVYHGR
ncbi:hypothetical protein KCU66_g945, partial [Aureobasidium melanogenum]